MEGHSELAADMEGRGSVRANSRVVSIVGISALVLAIGGLAYFAIERGRRKAQEKALADTIAYLDSWVGVPESRGVLTERLLEARRHVQAGSIPRSPLVFRCMLLTDEIPPEVAPMDGGLGVQWLKKEEPHSRTTVEWISLEADEKSPPVQLCVSLRPVLASKGLRGVHGYCRRILIAFKFVPGRQLSHEILRGTKEGEQIETLLLYIGKELADEGLYVSVADREGRSSNRAKVRVGGVLPPRGDSSKTKKADDRSPD